MILDEIISIKKIGTKSTIDIEVDGDHLFYCNGILTHNSAAGDTNDVTEENVQGGISKVQAADNILAFIPNAQSRELGVLRAKFMKTRDSGGVGSYVDFKVDWSTLTFSPWESDNNAENFKEHVQSNNPTGKLEKTTKGKAKKPKINLRNDTGNTVSKSDKEEETKKPRSIITSIGGKKKKSLNKSVKFV